MFQTSLLIALAVNGLFCVPIYQRYVSHSHRWTKDGRELKNGLYCKPLNCIFCMAFWVGFVVAIYLYSPGGYLIAALPIATAFLATLLNRLFHSLPISI